MTKEEIVQLFIKDKMPQSVEGLAALIKELEEKGLIDKGGSSPTKEAGATSSDDAKILKMFGYKDGQKARVKKVIISGDLRIEVGTVVTKFGEKYSCPSGRPNENFDIPANQVEGNGEFFEFPDADGKYVSINTLLGQIPTPSLN